MASYPFVDHILNGHVKSKTVTSIKTDYGNNTAVQVSEGFISFVMNRNTHCGTISMPFSYFQYEEITPEVL